jgi:hypothetical protein
VLDVNDVVNVMAAYQPVVQPCGTRYRMLAQHVGANVGMLIVFNIPMIL